MTEQNDDILNTWRDLGEKIDKMKTGIEELKKERRSIVITFIEQKKNLLEQANMMTEERPGSPKAIAALKLPQPWDNYYYSDGLFYTRTLIGNASSGDRPLLRQIGEGETDVLLGGSNLLEILTAIHG